MNDLPQGFDLFQLENALWVVAKPTRNLAYDVDFNLHFACRRPRHRGQIRNVVARVGALNDYQIGYQQLKDCDVELVNSPAQHENGSEVPSWYPMLDDCTPRSRWYDDPPSVETIEEIFGWPVFVKGARQTSRHAAAKCIARNREEYTQLVQAYQNDTILRWQQCVIREFVQLRSVGVEASPKVRPSFEFRTFWWHDVLVGAGPYWQGFANYRWSNTEREECLKVAQSAASRIDCPFLVVDMAQTQDGQWIVIECNDGQESGYSGVSPNVIWNNVARLVAADA